MALRDAAQQLGGMTSISIALTLPVSAEHLVRAFGEHPGVEALAVMGSHARGDSGPYSDIDVVRFTSDPGLALPDDGTHVVERRLVVVSTVHEDQLRMWFEQPELAVAFVAGIRAAQVLVDHGFLALWQERARCFVWNASLRARADRWVSAELVGWAEEVHKGLEGLRRGGDVGRLLNARHGCTFGLSRIVQVHRRVLTEGDNDFYDALDAALGPDSEWARLRRTAFGVQDASGRAPTLPEQVRAGLKLYVVTAELVASAVQPEHRAVIDHTVGQILALDSQT